MDGMCRRVLCVSALDCFGKPIGDGTFLNISRLLPDTYQATDIIGTIEVGRL